MQNDAEMMQNLRKCMPFCAGFVWVGLGPERMGIGAAAEG